MSHKLKVFLTVCENDRGDRPVREEMGYIKRARQGRMHEFQATYHDEAVIQS